MKTNKNDNDLLLEYQEEYLKNGSQNAYNKIWEISYIVTERLVIKMAREKRIKNVDVKDATINALEYVLRRYKVYEQKGKAPYRILNFICALRFGVLHALLYAPYSTKFQNQCDELTTENECFISALDYIQQYAITPEEYLEQKNPISEETLH